MTKMLEDAEERAAFDRTVNALFQGNPMKAIAAAMTALSKANPPQGSLSKLLAIYSNECAKVAKRL